MVLFHLQFNLMLGQFGRLFLEKTQNAKTARPKQTYLMATAVAYGQHRCPQSAVEQGVLPSLHKFTYCCVKS